ncbi:MAG: hypothetical protein H0U50_10405, partial [Pyrinomonadaceae bacterium]|nr:hypothetical protein [Pyrinomonadaceae bacterium]
MAGGLNSSIFEIIKITIYFSEKKILNLNKKGERFLLSLSIILRLSKQKPDESLKILPPEPPHHFAALCINSPRKFVSKRLFCKLTTKLGFVNEYPLAVT